MVCTTAPKTSKFEPFWTTIAKHYNARQQTPK